MWNRQYPSNGSERENWDSYRLAGELDGTE